MGPLGEMRLDSAQTSRMTRGQQCVFHGSGRAAFACQPAMDRPKMILDACALPGLTWRARQDSNPRPAA